MSKTADERASELQGFVETLQRDHTIYFASIVRELVDEEGHAPLDAYSALRKAMDGALDAVFAQVLNEGGAHEAEVDEDDEEKGEPLSIQVLRKLSVHGAANNHVMAKLMYGDESPESLKTMSTTFAGLHASGYVLQHGAGKPHSYSITERGLQRLRSYGRPRPGKGMDLLRLVQQMNRPVSCDEVVVASKGAFKASDAGPWLSLHTQRGNLLRTGERGHARYKLTQRGAETLRELDKAVAQAVAEARAS